MRIAAHHIEGTPQHRLSAMLGTEVSYTPACAWPDDCTVQWGHGIAPAVPFFEVFIPGTFIRGEGADIADAELKAFAQYQGELQCDHLWGRQRPGRSVYLNGAGWCRKCGAFRGRMFHPIVVLGSWRKPLDWMEKLHLDSLNDEEMNERMDRKYPENAANRRRRELELRLRFKLFGAVERPA